MGKTGEKTDCEKFLASPPTFSSTIYSLQGTYAGKNILLWPSLLLFSVEQASMQNPISKIPSSKKTFKSLVH